MRGIIMKGLSNTFALVIFLQFTQYDMMLILSSAFSLTKTHFDDRMNLHTVYKQCIVEDLEKNGDITLWLNDSAIKWCNQMMMSVICGGWNINSYWKGQQSRLRFKVTVRQMWKRLVKTHYVAFFLGTNCPACIVHSDNMVPLLYRHKLFICE